MSPETFAKALSLVRLCGQRTAWLHNFGEPLLHPNLVDFVHMAGENGVEASFYTNGLPLTDDLAVRLAHAGLRSLCVSEHVRGTADRLRAQLSRLGLPIEITETYSPTKTRVHTWAGQVAPPSAVHGFQHEAAGPCLFQRHNAAVILWDGRINVCCIDVEADHAALTVDDCLDAPDRYRFRAIPLCDGCTLMRGQEEL